MTTEELKQHYFKTRDEHDRAGRLIESASCNIYIMVIKRCEGKFKRGAHERFIRDWYADAGRRREDYFYTKQYEDALIQALTQTALEQFWVASGLELDSLKGILNYDKIGLT